MSSTHLFAYGIYLFLKLFPLRLIKVYSCQHKSVFEKKVPCTWFRLVRSHCSHCVRCLIVKSSRKGKRKNRCPHWIAAEGGRAYSVCLQASIDTRCSRRESVHQKQSYHLFKIIMSRGVFSFFVAGHISCLCFAQWHVAGVNSSVTVMMSVLPI